MRCTREGHGPRDGTRGRETPAWTMPRTQEDVGLCDSTHGREALSLAAQRRGGCRRPVDHCRSRGAVVPRGGETWWDGERRRTQRREEGDGYRVNRWVIQSHRQSPRMPHSPAKMQVAGPGKFRAVK